MPPPLMNARRVASRPPVLHRLLKAREYGIYRNVRNRIQHRIEEDGFLAPTFNARSSRFDPQVARSVIVLTISPDGQYVASAHADGHIRICTIATGELYHTLGGHSHIPWTVKFHPWRSDIVLSGCRGGEIRVWSLSERKCLRMLRSDRPVCSLAFSPDGQNVAIATGHSVLLWQWEESDAEGKPIHPDMLFHYHDSFVKYVNFTSDSKYIITTQTVGHEGAPSLLHIWRYGVSPPELAFTVPSVIVLGDGTLDISPCGTLLAVALPLFIPAYAAPAISASSPHVNRQVQTSNVVYSGGDNSNTSTSNNTDNASHTTAEQNRNIVQNNHVAASSTNNSNTNTVDIRNDDRSTTNTDEPVNNSNSNTTQSTHINEPIVTPTENTINQDDTNTNTTRESEAGPPFQPQPQQQQQQQQQHSVMVHSARMMNTIAIISLNEHDRGSMLYQATPFQESVVSVRFNSTSTNVVVGLKCPHPPGQAHLVGVTFNISKNAPFHGHGPRPLQILETLVHPIDIPNIIAYGRFPGDNMLCGTHTGIIRIFPRESRESLCNEMEESRNRTTPANPEGYHTHLYNYQPTTTQQQAQTHDHQQQTSDNNHHHHARNEPSSTTSSIGSAEPVTSQSLQTNSRENIEMIQHEHTHSDDNASAIGDMNHRQYVESSREHRHIHHGPMPPTTTNSTQASHEPNRHHSHTHHSSISANSTSNSTVYDPLFIPPRSAVQSTMMPIQFPLGTQFLLVRQQQPSSTSPAIQPPPPDSNRLFNSSESSSSSGAQVLNNTARPVFGPELPPVMGLARARAAAAHAASTNAGTANNHTHSTPLQSQAIGNFHTQLEGRNVSHTIASNQRPIFGPELPPAMLEERRRRAAMLQSQQTPSSDQPLR